MSFTEEQLDRLLSQQPITEQWPWFTCDVTEIENNIQSLITEICLTEMLKCKSEFNDYGSGYASFVDSWFYREEEDFRLGNCNDNHYRGIFVLFSRLSNYFVLGEGCKSWNATGGSSYISSFESIDEFSNIQLNEISTKITVHLETKGLQKLAKQQLSELIPSKYNAPTLLGDAPWVEFDALFYWED